MEKLLVWYSDSDDSSESSVEEDNSDKGKDLDNSGTHVEDDNDQRSDPVSTRCSVGKLEKKRASSSSQVHIPSKRKRDM